jgi:hypothetical protein
LSDTSWESNDFSPLAISLEEVLYIRSKGVWSGNENHIMFFCGAQFIKVEMIHYEGIAIGRKMDIEFEEKWYEAGWCWVGGVEREKDVSAGIDKIEEKFGCEIWSKAC